MNYQDIITQLRLLPNTFTRPGSGFVALLAAQGASLFRFANASDGIINQLVFPNASGVWLDVWGKLFGIPRNAQESDADYSTRISATLVASGATPVAMVLYLKIALGLTATITEDFEKTEWSLQFSTALTSAQYSQVLENLAYVRPAGVPTVPGSGGFGGTFTGTVNYLKAPRITGAYLEGGGSGLAFNISAFTNNSVPLLPTTFLSDPTLNPNLVLP